MLKSQWQEISQNVNEMISTCKEAGVPLYVAYYRRAMPRFVKIKELLENKAIGDIRLRNDDTVSKSFRGRKGCR